MDRSISRRSFLRSTAGGAASLMMASQTGAADRADKPNIILIMADDLGYECLSCYGATSYKTPHLDKLATRGMKFNHCYSQPLCTPSRVKIMTGKYNFRNYTNFGALDPKEKTFAHMLQSVGYKTCVVGKWQLYGSVNQSKPVQGTGSTPTQAGFDEYCLWQIIDRGSRYKDPIVNENSMDATIRKGKYGPKVSTDYALDFIDRNKDRPFLLYFPI